MQLIPLKRAKFLKPSFAWRSFGAGRLVLKSRLWLSRCGDPQSEFATLWQFGNNHRRLFAIRQHLNNPFQVPWQNFLFLRVLNIVKETYPTFTPAINIRGSTALGDLFGRHDPVVVITIHSLISPAIVLALEESNLSASMIVMEYPEELLHTLKSGKRIDIIYLSNWALLLARQKLRNGTSIVCCADDVAEAQLLMRTRIFEFAQKMEARILFALAQVSQMGEIDIVIRQAAAADKSPKRLVENFLEFLGDTLPVKKTWKIAQ
jgi:hypothetical protein